jgi:hypothetical protein
MFFDVLWCSLVIVDCAWVVFNVFDAVFEQNISRMNKLELTQACYNIRVRGVRIGLGANPRLVFSNQ